MKTWVKKSAKSKGTLGSKSNKSVGTRRKGNVDTYQKFTDLMVEKLEQGIIPWKQPWHSLGMPANYLTKRPYKGINLWVLLSFDHQYPYYLTFNQAQTLGGKIRKGAKAIPICYWNMVYKDGKTGNVIPEHQVGLHDPEQVIRSGFLKEYRVFPINQIDGITWNLSSGDRGVQLPEIRECQEILDGMLYPPKLVHQGESAFYQSDMDQITLPEKKLFPSAEAYYGVLFHELVHSTGHSTRLDRTGISEPHAFGSREYSKEELIAEMGAGYLNNLTGILNDALLDNSAAYIQNWLEELKNNKQLVVEAAGKAQQAVDYILTRDPF